MKFQKFFAATAIATTLCSGALAAELKIGYVDNQRVFRDAPAAIKVAKRLEQEFGERDKELQRLGSALQLKQETFEKQADKLSESDRRTKEREIGDLSRDFQRKQREFREDINLRQNEENAALIERANLAIKQIAESEKFDLIVQDVVWVGQRLDITDKVIKALSDGK